GAFFEFHGHAHPPRGGVSVGPDAVWTDRRGPGSAESHAVPDAAVLDAQDVVEPLGDVADPRIAADNLGAFALDLVDAGGDLDPAAWRHRRIRDLELEREVVANMAADRLTVHPYGAVGRDRLKAQPASLTEGQRGRLLRAAEPNHAVFPDPERRLPRGREVRLARLGPLRGMPILASAILDTHQPLPGQVPDGHE